MKITSIILALLTLFFIVLLSCSSQPSTDFEIVGKWQSLNEKSRLIEFKENNEIILFINEESLWAKASKNGELKFELAELTSTHQYIKIFNGDEFWLDARIEIVSNNRIRVYFFKHHNILDLADEFYRTDGFGNYHEIMESIKKE